MKRNIILLSLILSGINLFAQEKQAVNQYFLSAIEQAVVEYHQQIHVGYCRYMVVTMKIMKIDETTGKFVFNFIRCNYAYDDLKPTHYVYANDELVLIKPDNKCKINPITYGINEITEEVKKDALKILAGPRVVIGGQDPPYMIFKYKKEKVKGKFYLSYPPPKKYWF